MGQSKVDRFTKLKGVLVNNLLKEYHKQTKQQGDQIVYNHAVMEVEKILAHNTRLTEQQLQDLQRNFAAGVQINAPNRNIHVPTKKTSYSAKAAKGLAMSRSRASDFADTAQATGPASYEPPGVSQGMQTERREMTAHSPVDTTADSVHPDESDDGGNSKRQRRVDEWTLLVLHNDVQHLEGQKQLKAKELVEKKKTGEELRRQMLLKEEEKKKKKLEVVEIAQMQQADYMKWKAEQERAAQMKQARILAEKEHEAKELARVQKTKQIQAEKDFKEQQAMLAEFARQIEEEKKAKERESHAKAAAYQQMLKDNAKELDRKKAIKEAERQENQRLFEMQIEMAEKQERLREQREEERQTRLKKAERMAGELGSRAAEMDAELDARVKRAQEQYRVRDQERERDKLEKKKKRDEEMARVLQEQVGLRNQQREAARADRAAVAKQYRSDAEALVQAEAAAKRARAERKKAIQEDLDKQIALKHASKTARGMSTTELRLNKNLLQKVLREKEDIPEDLKERITGSPVMNADRSMPASALKTPRDIAK